MSARMLQQQENPNPFVSGMITTRSPNRTRMVTPPTQEVRATTSQGLGPEESTRTTRAVARARRGEEPTATAPPAHPTSSQVTQFRIYLNNIQAPNERIWLDKLVDLINLRYGGRLPLNGKAAVLAVYNSKFEPTTLTYITGQLNRIRTRNRNQESEYRPQDQSEHPPNETQTQLPPTLPPVDNNTTSTEHRPTPTVTEGATEMEEGQGGGGANHGGEEGDGVTTTITNPSLFATTREIFAECYLRYCVQGEDKEFTPRLYSKDIKYEVIEYINIIIDHEQYDSKIHSLADLNNMFYVAQVAYHQVIKRMKEASQPKRKWRESIVAKIAKQQMKLDILNGWDRTSPPTKELKHTCAALRVHSNSKDIDEARQRLQEQISMHEKRLRLADDRTKRAKDNWAFECKRASFYRMIDGEQYKPSEDTDTEAVKNFWTNLWRARTKESSHEELLSKMTPCSINITSTPRTIERLIEDQLAGMGNWKAAGPDKVYTFTIKKTTALRKKMLKLVAASIEDPANIHDDLYEGVTYLLPKVQDAITPDQFRPITCLSTLFKLISRCVTAQLRQLIEVNQVLSRNQFGTRRQCQGAKEMFLTNKALNIGNGFQLKTSWLDLRKAYDHVDHGYLMDIINKINCPSNIAEFVQRTLNRQRTMLTLNNERIGMAKIDTGILQGDALSPLLFCLAIEPMSRTLNELPQVEAGVIRRNHLIFIDDIKLIAETEGNLHQLERVTLSTLESMGFVLNQDKSCTNAVTPELITKTIDTHEAYKYLGIWENRDGKISNENKTKLKSKLINRVDSICKTKLIARNFSRAINEFALSTANYMVGIVDFEPKEFEDIDKDVRRCLYQNEALRASSNIDRLYLPRVKQGRGFTNLADKAEIMLVKLNDYCSGGGERREIGRAEEQMASTMSIIRELLIQKYQLPIDFTIDQLKAAQEGQKMANIDRKEAHKQQFKQDNNGLIDFELSSAWLTHGYATPSQEATYTKLQDRNTQGESENCMRCNQEKWSVSHVATQCHNLRHFDYVRRHNEVMKIIHHNMCRRYGLTKTSLKGHLLQGVVSNARATIKLDLPTTTDTKVQHYKPDGVLYDKAEKKITIIEVGVTSRERVARVEGEKRGKYEPLASELRSQHVGWVVEVVPIVIAWDGAVTRHFPRHLAKLKMDITDLARMQLVILNTTAAMVRGDTHLKGLSHSIPPDA